MDPATIISIVHGTLGLTLKCGQIVKDLHALRSKYKNAELSILSIIEQCRTIEFAWGRVRIWLEAFARKQFRDDGLVQRLDQSLLTGEIILSALFEDISTLNPNTHGVTRRTKFVWNESLFADHQQRLRDGALALTLLLESLKLPSLSERQSFLSEKANTFSKIDESAWSIVDSRAPPSLHIRHSTCSTDTTEIKYKPFSFEDVLFVSRVYTRNLRNTSYIGLLGERSVALQHAEASDTVHRAPKDRKADPVIDISGDASDADTVITFSRSYAKSDARPEITQIAGSTTVVPLHGLEKPLPGLPPCYVGGSEYWTQCQLLVRSFMSAEKLYVKELENLLSTRSEIPSEETFCIYMIRDMFVNIDSILDSHVPFMVNMEHIHSKSQPVQDWNMLFSTFYRLLEVYTAYVVNHRRFRELASWMEGFVFNRDDLELGRILETPAGLTPKLLKPVQHLSNYSTFLKDLGAVEDLDESCKRHISQCLAALTSMQEHTNNATVLEEDLQNTFLDFWNRANSLGEIRPDPFGKPILHGTAMFQLHLDRGLSNTVFEMFLFEKFLLLCRGTEVGPGTKSIHRISGKGERRLQIDGYFYGRNILELKCHPGSSKLHIIFAASDGGLEDLKMIFPDQATTTRWTDHFLFAKANKSQSPQSIDSCYGILFDSKRYGKRIVHFAAQRGPNSVKDRKIVLIGNQGKQNAPTPAVYCSTFCSHGVDGRS